MFSLFIHLFLLHGKCNLFLYTLVSGVLKYKMLLLLPHQYHLFKKAFDGKSFFFFYLECSCFTVLLVSAVHWSESATGIRISPLFWISFSYRSPQSTEFPVLCSQFASISFVTEVLFPSRCFRIHILNNRVMHVALGLWFGLPFLWSALYLVGKGLFGSVTEGIIQFLLDGSI